jgi:hypothetical protein
MAHSSYESGPTKVEKGTKTTLRKHYPDGMTRGEERIYCSACNNVRMKEMPKPGEHCPKCYGTKFKRCYVVQMEAMPIGKMRL